MSKFRTGETVHIGPLPPMMSHFTSGVDALVMYTYSQRYGGENNKEYCLALLDGGRCVSIECWYPEEVLTLVRSKRKEGKKLINRLQQRSMW